MADDDLFREAPEEVTRYFDAKDSQPSFDWRDIAPEEHSRTFTVAKTTGFDVLEDIRATTAEAIRNQLSFEEFRANLEPALRKKGWWGKAIAEDPQSGPRLSQLGSPRRLRTIYWANITTARAAGEWERIQRTKRFLPILRYKLSNAEKRRPEHEGWVGTMLPADHVWWLTHYPPNGWLCKCGVEQLTRGQAERLGFNPELPPPVIETKKWINKRTGETIFVPVGIDPGWHTNPGLLRQQNAANFLGDRLARLDQNRRRIAITDIVGGKSFRQMIEQRGSAEMIVPIGPVPQAIIDDTGTKARHVFLSSSSAKHILDEHEDRVLSPDDLANALEVLGNPEYVQPKGKASAIVGNSNNLRWRLVLKVLEDEVWLVSFHRRSRKRK